jgi:hypothetical protein
MKIINRLLIGSLFSLTATAAAKDQPELRGGALAEDRPRVIVSTDVGGSDPDDFQSLVHLLLYADVLDIEGLISSPPGRGREAHIREVIDAYAEDYDRDGPWHRRRCAPIPHRPRWLFHHSGGPQNPRSPFQAAGPIPFP